MINSLESVYDWKFREKLPRFSNNLVLYYTANFLPGAYAHQLEFIDDKKPKTD